MPGENKMLAELELELKMLKADGYDAAGKLENFQVQMKPTVDRLVSNLNEVNSRIQAKYQEIERLKKELEHPHVPGGPDASTPGAAKN